MLGLELIWDQALQTFYLGQLPIEIDFIEELKPYEKGYYGVNRITNNNFIDIVGKKYDHFINYSGGYAYYNLGGQYTQLRFKAYSSNDTVITFFGDNDALLSKIIVKGKELPLEHRVDLSNVARLVISIDGYGDIFDAYIK